MAYDSNNRCCGTCAYWVGQRTYGAFNTIDFTYNCSGNCGKPGAAILCGGYSSNRGSCNDWKYAL